MPGPTGGYRESFKQNKMFGDVGPGLGWPSHELPYASRNFRWTINVFGGGGFAGGGYQQDDAINEPGIAAGFAIGGDWGFYALWTGVGAPCCVYYYSNFFCTGENFTRLLVTDYMHELLHGMGVDSHNPYVSGFDPLSAQQKADLLNNNRDFLYPVP